jgi:hypothetical protein
MQKVVEVVDSLPIDVFGPMDDFSDQEINLTKSNVFKGGFEGMGRELQLLGKFRGHKDSGYPGTAALKEFVYEVIERVRHGEGIVHAHAPLEKANLTYFDCVAFLQSYLYVTSLQIPGDQIASEVETIGSATLSFYKIARETIKHRDGVPSKFMKSMKPEMPAVWMYVYVCVTYQRVMFTRSTNELARFDEGPGAGTLKAIKDNYLPLCKSVMVADQKIWRIDNSRFEIQGAATGHLPIICQLLYFRWFRSQLAVLAGNSAIVKADSVNREEIKTAQLMLPVVVGDKQQAEELDSYVQLGEHFFRRVESNNLDKYLTRMLNYFFTNEFAPGDIKAGNIPHGYLALRQGTYTITSDSDCLVDGTAFLSSAMLKGGMTGVMNLRLRLETKTTAEALSAYGGVTFSDGTHSLAQYTNLALKNALNDASVNTTIGNDGKITIVVAYDAAMIVKQDGKLTICVDGAVERNITRQMKERVESISYRGVTNERPNADRTSNTYDKGSLTPQPFGITCLSNAVPDNDSRLCHQLVMTVPPGHISNLYRLWRKNANGQAFEEFLATDKRSVEYISKLPDDTRRMLKQVMPVTNQSTGLMEVCNTFSEHGVPMFVTEGDKAVMIPVETHDETRAANGAPFTYADVGLTADEIASGRLRESMKPIRQDLAADTSGINMEVATLFVAELEKTDSGRLLKEDLLNLVYDLWRATALGPNGGLLDLIGSDLALHTIWCRKYLQKFYESQFVQMVVRQGYERQTYGIAARDIILIRLVLGTFMTLQTPDFKMKSGLSRMDIIGIQESREGPMPDHALIEPARRNMKAVTLRNSQIPSYEEGVGGLLVFFATLADIATLMKAPGDASFSSIFAPVQKLKNPREHGAGVIEDEVQRRQTYVNCRTHFLTSIAFSPAGGDLYRQSPHYGREVGSIKNPGFGAGGLTDLDAVHDLNALRSVDNSEGLGSDRFIKLNEGGQLVTGIDTLARQMFALQEQLEFDRPEMRGQILMVSTGMFIIYTGLVWDYPTDSDKATILQRKMYVDANVRFSSKMMRGRNAAHNLKFAGLAKNVMGEGDLITPMGTSGYTTPW